MRSKFFLGATALAAFAVVQWLPTTASAVDAIPTSCLTNPAPTGPQGDPGPQGDQGPIGDPGPDGTLPPGPSRQPHPAEVSAPQCDDIEDICIVKLPGEKGPQGDKGETGEKGPQGESGQLMFSGPSRAPHSIAGADPCAGVAEVCELTIVGPDGPKGEQGPKGEPGPQGPPGTVFFINGPARDTHPQIILQQVLVEIPTDCLDHLESLVPVPTTVAPSTTGVGSGGGTLPATGGSNSMAMVAAALVALGGAVLLVRRRSVA